MLSALALAEKSADMPRRNFASAGGLPIGAGGSFLGRDRSAEERGQEQEGYREEVSRAEPGLHEYRRNRAQYWGHPVSRLAKCNTDLGRPPRSFTPIHSWGPSRRKDIRLLAPRFNPAFRVTQPRVTADQYLVISHAYRSAMPRPVLLESRL